MKSSAAVAKSPESASTRDCVFDGRKATSVGPATTTVAVSSAVESSGDVGAEAIPAGLSYEGSTVVQAATVTNTPAASETSCELRIGYALDVGRMQDDRRPPCVPL